VEKLESRAKTLEKRVAKLEKELAEARSRDYKVLWQTFLKEASLLRDDVVALGNFVYQSGRGLRSLMERTLISQ
jgi:hypothetical protein